MIENQINIKILQDYPHKLNESKIVQEIKKNPVAVEHRKIDNHVKEEDFMIYFEKNFSELRAEYNRFSAEWM